MSMKLPQFTLRAKIFKISDNVFILIVLKHKYLNNNQKIIWKRTLIRSTAEAINSIFL